MIATHLTRLADDAVEALRGINYNLVGVSCSAPVASGVLGSLKDLGPVLARALGQIGTGLNCYQVDDVDPAGHVAEVVALLDEAGEHAWALFATLECAEHALAAQGYREHGEGV